MPGFLVDSSVWVAAVFVHHPGHHLAQSELAKATGRQPALFCRATQQSFLRLITTPSLLRHYQAEGFTNRAALAEYQLLLSMPEIAEKDEPPGTATLWQRLACRDTASPKVWMDAYLAAFAISGGLEFVTLDRDFQAFESQGLKLRLLTPAG